MMMFNLVSRGIYAIDDLRKNQILLQQQSSDKGHIDAVRRLFTSATRALGV